MLYRPKPVVLLILNGFGYTLDKENNAIAIANTPCWDKLLQDCPSNLLSCSGAVVGLPDGQMVNSEAGHLHIGTGRYIPQDFSKVNDAIVDGSFYTNPVLCRAVVLAKEKNKSLHIMGLLSPGGLHSHEDQIVAIVGLAAKRGLDKIYLHAFLDDRDVPPKNVMASLELLDSKFKALDAGQIASIVGRFYAMDTDNRWDRVKRGYDLIAKGEAEFNSDSALHGFAAAYGRGETDEFVLPTAILNAGQQTVALDPDDSVVFMNFRADRAREISVALTAPGFDGFEKNRAPHPGYFCTLTEYQLDSDYDMAFPPTDFKNCLGEYLSTLGMTQLRLAETEKFAHVLFCLNSGIDAAFLGEDRILIPSPKVRTYDLQPEINAPVITDNLVAAITGDKYDVIISNYANCDMVGHTGIMDAAILAVQAVATSLQRIVDALKIVGGQMLKTADHGNIEQMRNKETEQPHTAHPVNPVPLVYVGGNRPLKTRVIFSDLAPTILAILAILGVEHPGKMTGRSLINFD
jgi:2,3-bisphosphoglycerate-independent phosphoglycerate mutase